MPTYISLVNYTDTGIKKIKESPKRLNIVKKLAKKMGGEIKDFYLTVGDHDIVVVTEMPSDEKLAQFLLTVGSTGAIRTKTLTAFHEDEYKKIIKKI